MCAAPRRGLKEAARAAEGIDEDDRAHNTQAGSAALASYPAQPSSAHELKTLVLSRHSLIVIETVEEERVDVLAAEASKRGKPQR